MIVTGKRYEIIYTGTVHEYNRRGEYGGTGHTWNGVVRIQTVRGRLVSIFKLNADVSSPRQFDPEFLFTRSRGAAHYDDFVVALPNKTEELTDYIAELLATRAQGGRHENEPLADVDFSGLFREQAMRLGFVAGREGQVAMRV